MFSPVEFPESFLALPVHLNGLERAAEAAAGKSPRLQELRDRVHGILEQMQQNRNAISQTLTHPEAELSAWRTNRDFLAGERPAVAKEKRLAADCAHARSLCEVHRRAIADYNAELVTIREELETLAL